MDKLLDLGVEKGLIAFDADQKNITYKVQNKKFRYTDSEEQVRVKAYLSLVFDYGYAPEQIDIEYPVPHRQPNLFADAVVFTDKTLKSPLILVECKREDASQGEINQGIEQGFGYSNSSRAHYLWVTSGIRNDYFNVLEFPANERIQNRLADLPRAGQKAVSRYKYVKGGISGFELKTVEEAELTRIFKQAHDSLWAGGKRNPSEAFDELDKLIFCKIWDEQMARKKGEPYDFQVFTDDHGDDLKKRIQKLYENGRAKDQEVFKEDIRLSNAELQTVVGYLAGINLHDTDLDSKGRAFETFMTGFFRGEFGQYFTPRNIVKFIVDALPIDNESLVLDTSCGSGGFLLHALDKVRRQADEYYDKDAEKVRHKAHWHDFAECNLFGIEISEGIARTAKMNMIIHDDGHTNVIAMDGLEPIDKMPPRTNKKGGFKASYFDFIITNPPFGSKIKWVEKRYVENYVLGCKDVDWIDAKLNNINLLQKNPRDQQTTEVLFLEQCHRFLKPGGYLAMVIPDSILTNSSMQYVRDWIEDHWRIVAVVSLPQFAFAANGAGVKSSVLFLKKYADATTTALKRIKEQAQDSLFAKESGGKALEQLIEEKKAALKHGDETIRAIEEELVSKLDALTAQYKSVASDNAQQRKEKAAALRSVEKELKAQAKAEVEDHKKTDVYETWRQTVSEEFNERIDNLKEALADEFLAEVKAKLEDYQIFMAIAEDIGYDATGRLTANHELDTVATELARFIGRIEK